jgi:hypothetical protein
MTTSRLPLSLLLLLLAGMCGCVIETPSNRPEGSLGASPTPLVNTTSESTRPPDENPKLTAYVSKETLKLGAEERNAIERIDGEGLRLLAMRAYLRAGGDAKSHWSWSQEQIESFKRSDEYKDALAEVEKVKARFAEENPGYALRVNPEVRSIEQQVKSWNETASVKRAADDLLTSANKELSNSNYKESPDDSDLLRFEQFLRNSSTTVTPTIAAPGLSPHGQLRAFDFQITKGGELIAGTSSADATEVWDNAGWTTKLKKAVGDASNRFDGPLSTPPEPWHYNYSAGANPSRESNAKSAR